jgi:hypothetical protein
LLLFLLFLPHAETTLVRQERAAPVAVELVARRQSAQVVHPVRVVAHRASAAPVDRLQLRAVAALVAQLQRLASAAPAVARAAQAAASDKLKLNKQPKPCSVTATRFFFFKDPYVLQEKVFSLQ